MTFDDGSTRTLTADPRVDFASSDACAITDNDADSISVASGAKAAGCTAITVTATITLSSTTFVVTASSPLVFMDYISLDFTGYPSVNSGVLLTTLNAIECMPGAYHHASARVRAFLTDSPTTSYVVTSQSALSSSDSSVIFVDGTRMRGTSPGSAVITANFGQTPTTASATLNVSDTQVRLLVPSL